MNRLQYEKSPYLLQHRDNPVDWYPWGPEALNKASKEDKPILLSIGYSSCHWCHVMEMESFTDARVAEYMNANFINIKLDREERPDLDKIYMDAIMALSGSGGWPLNCFLLPDKRPFYGGTYFPPRSMHKRPSWVQILQFIVQIFTERRAEVEEQASRLTEHIVNSGNTLLQVAKMEQDGLQDTMQIGSSVFDLLKRRFDRTWGGYGAAPKFPATMSHRFLLDYYFYSGDKEALNHVIQSLHTMSRAGIYDQIGGGFARYATDKEWNIPHFEKMLYDNAQFISLLSIAFKISRLSFIERIVRESFRWLIRDMKSPHGGYYSAIDADSEHEEGKYYIWTVDELQTVLSIEEFNLLNNVYAIEQEGNWEDSFHANESPKNILWVRKDTNESILNSAELAHLKLKLLDIRSKRIPPLTDTKIILSWNALLSIGLFDAYDAFNDSFYLDEALEILNFIGNNLLINGAYKHQYDSAIPPMLDDLAYSIAAFLQAYRSTGNGTYLAQGQKLAIYVMQHYFNKGSRSFSYSISKNDLIAPANDLYDNTMPSAVGTMAYNLVALGRILAFTEWESLGNDMISDLSGAIVRYPESLSHWASLLLNQLNGWMEVKTGLGAEHRPILSKHIPSLILHNDHGSKEKEISFCHNFSCEKPVKSYEEFRLLLDCHYHS